jgi:(p)ppGpp synthase/HD superfamily hydrolase
MNLVMKAIQFATIAHKGQERKATGAPFITHPYAVGMMLAMEGYSEEVIAAGILHDVWEDTDVELEEITELFGEVVSKLVWYASEPDKNLTWEERKEHTIHTIKTAPLDAKSIVCADKIHNVKSIIIDKETLGEQVWDSFKRGKDQQKWYYTNIYSSLIEGVEKSKQPKLFSVYKELLDELFV